MYSILTPQNKRKLLPRSNMQNLLPIKKRSFAIGAFCAAVMLLPCSLGAFFPFGDSEPRGAKELTLGDTAAREGNTVLAEKYYRKALELGSDDTNLWSKCVSRLGTVCLQNNDIASAKKLLAEFRERVPAGCAGTLPGEIMAAENDFDGAEKVFNSLIKRNDSESDRAKYCLAGVRMKQQRYQESYDIYSALRKSGNELVAKQSEYSMVQAALKLGKFEEVKKILDTDTGNRNYKKLRLLCAVKEGDLEYFRKNSSLNGDEKSPDDFMCSLFEQAAELFQKKGDSKFAAQLYENAFSFAADKEKKCEIIEKLFNCCSEFDAQMASAVAERYNKLFPDDRNGTLLLMQSGDLLAANKMYKLAVKFFDKVVQDKENRLVERNDAARKGAAAAALGGLFDEAEKFYQHLISSAQNAGSQSIEKLQYAEYLLRRQMHKKADEVLLSLIGGDVFNSTTERAVYHLLQSKSAQNSLSENELALAQNLEKSANRTYAEYGCFTVAEICNLSGRNNEEVRKKYLDFISTYPDSKFVAQAHFQAARLAGRRGDFTAAAGEFAEFADKYSKHPNAGAARFLAIDSFCRANNSEKAEVQLKKLSSAPDSKEAFTSAVLAVGEYFLNSGNTAKALDTVNQMILQHPELDRRSDIMFLKSRILFKKADYDAAIKELDRLCKLPDGTAELAEAHCLAGNIRFDTYQDYAAAEKNFCKACELVKNGISGYAYSGRLADCRLNMYMQTNDTKQLESAESLYRNIAENAKLPDLRIQASYKAGYCREVAGDREKALDDYEQTLCLALTFRSFGIVPVQSWCERAAYSAINIALGDNEFADTTKAQELLSLYRNLGYENSERDFKVLRKRIRERLKLLKRGAKY